MTKEIFNMPMKIILSIIILLGTVLLGFGIGLLVCKVLEVFLISVGLGFLLIALFLIMIEFENY
jgi:hypothetical protein